VRWVADRLALVELVPESVQQQVRRGAISAHVAMKFLVPVARSRPEDCQRLAEAFAAHHSTSREAGQLYAAWRDASPAVRERILKDPELFLKAQRQHSPDPPAPLITQLLRDLEMVVAIIRRENRRLVGATVALDPLECAQIHGRIAQAQQELHRLAGKIPQEEEHVEPRPTDHDSGIACPRSEQTRDCPGAEDQPAIGTQSSTREPSGSTETLASGEGRALSPADSGTARQLQGESGAGAGGASGQRSESVVLDPDRLLPPTRHRTTAHRAVWKLLFSARPRNSARHLSPRARAERQAPQGATASAVLCYSRMLFFQMYPTFTRFDAKIFLTDALRYFGSVPTRVVIDNTHLVVLHGTGREIVPVPEMAAFADRFGFQFLAHELGDANRSARVERPFWFIEKNFLAGRRFTNWQDLNQQARQWCDRVNATYKNISAPCRASCLRWSDNI
jgi:hypothetical protein